MDCRCGRFAVVVMPAADAPPPRSLAVTPSIPEYRAPTPSLLDLATLTTDHPRLPTGSARGELATLSRRDGVGRVGSVTVGRLLALWRPCGGGSGRVPGYGRLVARLITWDSCSSVSRRASQANS